MQGWGEQEALRMHKERDLHETVLHDTTQKYQLCKTRLRFRGALGVTVQG